MKDLLQSIWVSPFYFSSVPFSFDLTNVYASDQLVSFHWVNCNGYLFYAKGQEGVQFDRLMLTGSSTR
jgi:hypothetical protein